MYDELIKRLRECTAEQNGEKTLWHQAADAIEELSKQRDLALTRLCEWCGVCSKEHRDAWGCDDIARLQELQLPRWIPVTERLPEDRNMVLATVDGVVRIAFYGNYMWEEVETYSILYPTHWMPLPEPPEVM